MNMNFRLVVKWLMFGLFILSAVAKLYPTPMYGITKIFEEGQLIPMGFSENLAPYFSRIIIAIEFFIAFAFGLCFKKESIISIFFKCLSYNIMFFLKF